MMRLEELIPVARGEAPADHLLTDCRLINVYTGEIYEAEVALLGGPIAGVGPGYSARRTISLGGRYLCPGFIDAHLHLESTMLLPTEFARAVVPLGTTSVVCDPHEIANVCGLDGIHYLLDAAQQAPMSVFANAPSCVPATPMSTAGASLGASDLLSLRDDPRVLGLAEMMNFPGVISAVPDVLAKLEAYADRPIDGHAPGLSGKALNAYIGTGIGSDHECSTAREALEKVRLGMRVLIREGTATRDLAALLPAVTQENARRFCLCTDDRHPADLLNEGHIDALVRASIAAGADPITAIQMVTLNPAEWFRLWDRGVVAPGKRADLVAFSDLNNVHAEMVFVGGRLVARDGELLIDHKPTDMDDRAVRSTVRMDADSLNLRIQPRNATMRVIGAIRDQVVTEHRHLKPTVRDGQAVADPARDLLKLAVIERHRGTGNVGLGFIQGIGLKQGAIASTVCHDHHNLIVAGADDASMMTAVRAVAAMGGGEVVAVGDRVVEQLPLPIAGLMSDQPINDVCHRQNAMLQAAASLGCPLPDPFMTLSFMALEVIPSLKLTDQGLVDVDKFMPVDLWVQE